MSANQAIFSIRAMCRVLEVSASGYYAWRQRMMSVRAREDEQLQQRTRAIHLLSRCTYASPRIHADLKEEGTHVGRKRVARLMRAARLQGVSRRRSTVTTRRDRLARPAPIKSIVNLSPTRRTRCGSPISRTSDVERLSLARRCSLRAESEDCRMGDGHTSPVHETDSCPDCSSYPIECAATQNLSRRRIKKALLQRFVRQTDRMNVVIAVTGLLLGGWVILKSLRAIVSGVLSESWPTATGSIEAVTIETKLNSEAEEVSRQRVEYSYVVGGNTYRGARIRFGLPPILRWSSQPGPFNRGESVAVIHNPSQPEMSTLQRGFSAFALFTLAVGCLIVWASMKILLL